jgi:hypothetical protein
MAIPQQVIILGTLILHMAQKRRIIERQFCVIWQGFRVAPWGSNFNVGSGYRSYLKGAAVKFEERQ